VAVLAKLQKGLGRLQDCITRNELLRQFASEAQSLLHPGRQISLAPAVKALISDPPKHPTKLSKKLKKSTNKLVKVEGFWRWSRAEPMPNAAISYASPANRRLSMPKSKRKSPVSPEGKTRGEHDRRPNPKDDKPVPVTQATEHGIENADNADYADGHNIGP
jgi:hypothetical protein